MLPGASEMRERGSSTFVQNAYRTIRDINVWIKDTSEDLAMPVIDLNSAFRDPQDENLLAARYSCGDHAHLNGEGYKHLADVIYSDYLKDAEDLSSIVCLGDSHTQGYPGRALIDRNGYTIDPKIDSDNQFPYWLAELTGVSVINRGIAGNTVYGMLNRFESEVIMHLPDHCIILGGTNDVLLGTPIEDTKQDLLTLFEKCIGSDIVPIAGTIIPLGIELDH
ncbi:MAG: hypothetical protein KAH57_06645 [Thermoplasmata archaeon]|nr:hypothetical protein [Thermoplasmata archaeon]